MTSPSDRRPPGTGKPRAAATAVSSSRPPAWTQPQAEAHLRSLELFGMRFGLDRMRRMMTVLGSPERRYDSVHIVGTNGKTSTTRMVAAILERHGLRTAAYTSPHLTSYRERLQVSELDVGGEELAEAIARAAWAAERVNRTLAGDDHVTQFELLTAAALWAMAERDVQVAAIEAGLGGRYDATAVIDSRVTALTNVGLEHTRWLGPTVRDIAEEKLAVLTPQTTLALGVGLAPEALAVAERVARERDARIVTARAEPLASAPSLAAAGAFQQRNFALARLVAESYLRDAGIEPLQRAIEQAAIATEVRGRLQVISHEPLTVLDGAHNPDAAQALVESLGAIVGDRPLALVLGVLEDKDAVGMLAPLLAVSERAWFTAPPSERALSPAALQSLARQLGFDRVACEPSPARALAQAQAWALQRGGAVLATGSVYLAGDLLARLQGERPTGERAEESGVSRRRASL
jgi:dihydrofolate synthase / folylpolyglutamate synthase